METRSTNALFKRAEQLKRWEESETNKECSILKDKPRKINFTDECVFLAACSAGDKDEVKRLLHKGAYIDTANVDGLTALHQACIDDNLEMVEFLVEHGADVNCGDNEGWTPLHATASCGFVNIAKYLIENGANVIAVNNDGELPLDIAEQDEMEELLQDELDKLGVDCDYARNIEEHMMLEDANRMLNGNFRIDERHPKTGATALHVSAAKNYVKVLRILIQAGLDTNIQDFDGWTPLHAAAHWGQRESCKTLIENMCNLEIENYAGQTAFDVADQEIISFLEDLKAKQLVQREEMKKKAEVESIIETRVFPSRVMATKLNVSEKTNNVNRDRVWERVPNDISKIEKTPSKLSSDNESESSESSSSEDSEIEKRNDVNKVTSAIGYNTNKEDVQGDQNRNMLPVIKDSKRENDVVATIELPKVIRKEEPVKLESESNITEVVVKAVPTAVTTSSLAINLPREPTATFSASVPSTPTSTNSQVRRSFVPPVRDEESETQRKAHAKRVRETRRSTQGVTLEDLKGAEQLVQKKNSQESEEKNNSLESEHEDSRAVSKVESAQDRDATISVERRPSWRIRMGRDESKPVDGDGEKMDGNIKRDDNLETNEIIGDQAIADKGYRSSRYGSTSSLSDVGSRGETPSKTSNRSSRAGSVGSSVSVNDASEIDYKKLYEEQKTENERLAEKQKAMEKDLEAAKLMLEKASAANQRNASSDADRREKRALERKLSEMEEELKQLQKLKAENEKLKAENRALTRVVSKLTK